MKQTITDPIQALRQRWLTAKAKQDPNARYCTFATLEGDAHQPRMRTLVLREITDTHCLLFVQQTSRKNLDELTECQWEMLLFYPSLMEQYRIRGHLSQLSSKEIYPHWKNKPYESKLLDLYYMRHQHQSTTLTDRSLFEQQIQSLAAEFPKDMAPPPPASAIGLCLVPNYIEMWQACESGLHQRDLFTLDQKQWHHQAIIP